MQSSPNQLSFLPDDYLERKARRRTNVICAALFLIVMAAIGSAFIYGERAIRELEKQNAQVDTDYNEAARRIQQVQQMQAKQRTMAYQAELTESLLEKVPRSYLMADITNSMPGGVSLLDFVLESRKIVSVAAAQPRTAMEAKRAEQEAKNKAPAGDPQRYDVYMKITGVASSDMQVSQFITKLLKSKLLTDVNLLVSEEHLMAGEKLRKFQIEMKLDPSAQVMPAGKQTRTAAVEMK